MLSTLHCSLLEQEKEKNISSLTAVGSFSWACHSWLKKFLREHQILLVKYYRNSIWDCPRKDLWLFFFQNIIQKLRIYQQNCTEIISYILSFPNFRWVPQGIQIDRPGTHTPRALCLSVYFAALGLQRGQKYKNYCSVVFLFIDFSF